MTEHERYTLLKRDIADAWRLYEQNLITEHQALVSIVETLNAIDIPDLEPYPSIPVQYY